MNTFIHHSCLSLRKAGFLTFFRLQHKVITDDNSNEKIKVAPDVINFLENNPAYTNIKTQIPKFLLRKYKTPEIMYLINENSAQHIAEILKNNVDSNSPIVEVNPGFCFLTKEILKWHKEKIYLYETSNNFIDSINVSLFIFI